MSINSNGRANENKNLFILFLFIFSYINGKQLDNLRFIAMWVSLAKKSSFILKDSVRMKEQSSNTCEVTSSVITII
jgi:hypothetical protein